MIQSLLGSAPKFNLPKWGQAKILACYFFFCQNLGKNFWTALGLVPKCVIQCFGHWLVLCQNQLPMSTMGLYKWITKVLNVRLEPLVDKFILKNQSAFMKRWDIMNGILALHEILHETKKNKQVGIVLKLDFEKTYDKMCWGFLFDNLKIRGFNSTWCNWICKVVSGGQWVWK